MGYRARQASPGQTFSFADASGTIRELRAGDDGRVVPKDRVEEQFLDVFGLPVAVSATKKKTEATEAGR